jgi:GT2 family glycosyltransferase
MNPKVSIIIVNYNSRDEIVGCLEQLRVTRSESSRADQERRIWFETIVVDNDSGDDSVAVIRADFPEVHLIAHERNAGFAAGNNLGIQVARGEYVLLLNPDARLSFTALRHLLGVMEARERCQVAGASLVDEAGRPQPSARVFPHPGAKLLLKTGLGRWFGYQDPEARPLPDEPCVVDWVVGACFLMRASALARHGGLDERYFLYFEEIDFCLNVKRAGGEVWFVPDALVRHAGGASSRDSDEHRSSAGRQIERFRIESEIRYYRKNYGPLTATLAGATEFLIGMVALVRSVVKRRRRSGGSWRADLDMLWLTLRIALRDRLGWTSPS